MAETTVLVIGNEISTNAVLAAIEGTYPVDEAVVERTRTMVPWINYIANGQPSDAQRYEGYIRRAVWQFSVDDNSTSNCDTA